jgi:hypothetical protein
MTISLIYRYFIIIIIIIIITARFFRLSNSIMLVYKKDQISRPCIPDVTTYALFFNKYL